MFYLFIIPIAAITITQQYRSIICGCAYLSPAECTDLPWCELIQQFDKCPINYICITYYNQTDCLSDSKDNCEWIDGECQSACSIMEYGQCKDREVDTNCTQYTTNSTCSAIDWCEYDDESNTCIQVQQQQCESIENQIECEDYGCAWDDIQGCLINDGDCTLYTKEDECQVHFQSNKQCIWFTENSTCVQSKDCSKYEYKDKDLCMSLSNCQFDGQKCNSCVQAMFSFEQIVYIASLLYLL